MRRGDARAPYLHLRRRVSRGELRGLGRVVALATAFCAIVLVLIVALSELGETQTSFTYHTRDPAAIVGESPFIGALTHVRVLTLWAAAAACVFAGLAIARLAGDGHRALPLLVVGAAVGWLAIDDLFLVHEQVLPRHAGIPESAVLSVYASAAAILAWWLRTTLRTSDWPLLALATAALVPAVAVDVLAADTETSWAVEDALMFPGFVFLAVYVMRLAGARLCETATRADRLQR
jgi:hypothetical protein